MYTCVDLVIQPNKINNEAYYSFMKKKWKIIILLDKIKLEKRNERNLLHACINITCYNYYIINSNMRKIERGKKNISERKYYFYFLGVIGLS